MISKLIALTLPFLAVGLIAAGPELGRASGTRLLVLGNSSAKTCSDHARLVADGKMSPNYAVETCTEALAIENLSPYDTAATHNNRGVLRLGMADEFPFAIEDFDAAARIDPGLGESYVNRGAVLMREERWAEAIVQLDRGIELGLKEPWRAYFNRGVAREAIDDVPGAYADYSRAQELKPDWAPPTEELARFTVRTR